jgi:hypothetical protein
MQPAPAVTRSQTFARGTGMQDVSDSLSDSFSLVAQVLIGAMLAASDDAVIRSYSAGGRYPG